MKCIKCGNNDALLLFNSMLCTNKTCPNFDENWEKEHFEKKKPKENYLTSTTSAGAIYLGEIEFEDIDESQTYTTITYNGSSTFYWYSNFYPYYVDTENEN